jgi:DNA-binding NtrC family response regulator
LRRILLVEDKRGMRAMLRTALEEDGWTVTEAANAADAAKELMESCFEAVLTDICLPGEGDGLKILAGTPSGVPVLLMTAYGTIDMAVEAMKAGARDFITKPFELDHLLKKLSSLPAEIGEEIIGAAPGLLDALKRADAAAESDLNILVCGESGTGKELLVKRIHRLSRRSGGPLIPVNCAAIPRDLLESELFGTEKGAYTGAGEAKPGRFELAGGGTVFLDEIGDLELSLQGKLLRVLEGSSFTRVGGTRQIHSNARTVAASNRDLLSMAEAGDFREDLYYRLSEFIVHIPPLRERTCDIQLLAEHFLKNRGVLGSDSLDTLQSYHWPGNVRQLRNILVRASILADGCPITPEMLEIPAAKATSLMTESARVSRDRERRMIRDALEKCQGNRSRAAKLLGVSYRTILKKIKEMDQV